MLTSTLKISLFCKTYMSVICETMVVLLFQSPSEIERGEMVDAMLQNVQSSGNIAIPYIAQRTAVSCNAL